MLSERGGAGEFKSVGAVECGEIDGCSEAGLLAEDHVNTSRCATGRIRFREGHINFVEAIAIEVARAAATGELNA